jgi:hypothetical protein
MGELLVAQALWLLGQDEQWMRPRVSAMPVAAAAGALVDLVNCAAASWVDADGGAALEPVQGEFPAGLLHDWSDRLVEAATSGSVPVIHAINAVSPGIWDSIGADLAARSYAEEVPRPVRRWLPPRRRPRHDVAEHIRNHLLEVLRGAQPATDADRGVLAVASCAGVIEHVLSRTAFTDSSVLAPTATFLEGSALVGRLSQAVSYLVSHGPLIGVQSSPPGSVI